MSQNKPLTTRDKVDMVASVAGCLVMMVAIVGLLGGIYRGLTTGDWAVAVGALILAAVLQVGYKLGWIHILND